MEIKEKRFRITIILDEDVAKMINEAAKKYGIPRTSYIKLATLEKINKEQMI